MAYDTATNERAYPTVLTDKTLLAIRANEVLRLTDGDSPFPDLWENNVNSLSPIEKEKVYRHLGEKAIEFELLTGNLRGNLTQKLMELPEKLKGSKPPEIKSLEDEVRWCVICTTRLQRGMNYLQSSQGFPQK